MDRKEEGLFLCYEIIDSLVLLILNLLLHNSTTSDLPFSYELFSPYFDSSLNLDISINGAKLFSLLNKHNVLVAYVAEVPVEMLTLEIVQNSGGAFVVLFICNVLEPIFLQLLQNVLARLYQSFRVGRNLRLKFFALTVQLILKAFHLAYEL
ncbi:hypothetical protein PanWU01x14_036720 [Parasponia andersonii]|uniref:Uncharacterized protein n=1 Tax=Parasponia andersonii TaxID=3476 RepID=A0A2P5DSI7_PARAD|nr:hypothetical protein PanWU01x14_036720 [Parasponia andersonii]